MCFGRAPVAQWSYEIEGKHCESKTFKVHNYLKRMLTAALAVRYLFWISCCGRLPVLIRKHQLQMIEIRKSLLTMMLKVTESVRDLFWKRCCGKVTSPCIKSWPLAAPASKQQQQWKTITIQWRWTPWCRCRSESPFTPSIISWALSVCIETKKKQLGKSSEVLEIVEAMCRYPKWP